LGPTELAMPYRASHRFARISSKKVQPVVTLIRGETVEDALNILKYTRLRAASLVSKVVASALANADHQGEPHLDRLYVSEARANPGPMIKRIRPRARGMAFHIRRRMAHIHIELDVEE